MAKTFIWFSRKESAFAINAHESGLNNQIDPWICLREIPPGAGWSAKIIKAINLGGSSVLTINPSYLSFWKNKILFNFLLLGIPCEQSLNYPTITMCSHKHSTPMCGILNFLSRKKPDTRFHKGI